MKKQRFLVPRYDNRYIRLKHTHEKKDWVKLNFRSKSHKAVDRNLQLNLV